MIPTEPKPVHERQKRYPIRCIECGRKDVHPAVVREEVRRNHDGRLYDLMIDDLPVTKCGACGEVYYSNDSAERTDDALREHLSLLSPDRIRANIESLGLTQKEVAERLGIAAETLSRWLTGAMIQSRAMDNLLRAFFGCAEVRAHLTGPGMDRHFGERVSAA